MWVSASHQLLTVRHASLDVHPSNLATASYRPKGRRGYSDRSLSGRQRSLSDQRGVKSGDKCHLHGVNLIQKLGTGYAVPYASKCANSWLHAIWHYMYHDPRVSQLGIPSWLRVQCHPNNCAYRLADLRNVFYRHDGKKRLDSSTCCSICTSIGSVLQ